MKSRCKKAVHYNLPITIHLEDRDLSVSGGCIMFSDKMRDFLYNPLTDIAILIANGEGDIKMKRKVLEGLKYTAGILALALLTGGPLIIAMYIEVLK